MKFPYTATQKQRLIELDAAEDYEGLNFPTEEERDLSFRKIHQQLVSKNRQRLQRLRQGTLRPTIRATESLLVKTLNEAGFVEVTTPTTLSKGMLSRMGIRDGHPLLKQIYWLEANLCLRPMLAPNLYHLLGYIVRIWPCPIRIFEVGQCFRKESKGARHLSEFTMLNMVEMGIDGKPQTRLEEMVGLVMDAVDMSYRLSTEKSEVYGVTTDIMVDDLEIGSGATGPHPLDVNWNIAENWAGLGIGLERLVMLKEGFKNIRRAGRSLIYLDGARLNI
ncbi:MAG: pyrrolysine--tRNA(Pyl) ligase large subunit [Pseudomonadota bacterium]